jgi:hypothetical protein
VDLEGDLMSEDNVLGAVTFLMIALLVIWQPWKRETKLQ